MSNYFIKRGEKVNGPFSVEQITGGIKTKKLTARDDIATSENGPWYHLQDVYKKLLGGQTLEPEKKASADLTTVENFDVDSFGQLDDLEDFQSALDYESPQLPSIASQLPPAASAWEENLDVTNRKSTKKPYLLVLFIVAASVVGLAICGGVLFMVFWGKPSVADNKPLHFSTTDSETAFAFMASLPEFKSLAKESPSVLVNPVRRKAVAETLQERLVEFVNTEVNWQGALVSIEERFSTIAYFSAGPDPKNPILLFFRVQVWNDANDDAQRLRKNNFVLDNYTKIIGSSEKLGSLSFSATIKSIKVYTGREHFCTANIGGSNLDAQLIAIREKFNNSDLNSLLIKAQYDTPDLYKRLPFESEMDCPIVEVELNIHAFGQHAPSEKLKKSGQRDPSKKPNKPAKELLVGTWVTELEFNDAKLKNMLLKQGTKAEEISKAMEGIKKEFAPSAGANKVTHKLNADGTAEVIGAGRRKRVENSNWEVTGEDGMVVHVKITDRSGKVSNLTLTFRNDNEYEFASDDPNFKNSPHKSPIVYKRQ